ncbi:MAG: hypothetical protein J6J61_02430 [Muribaculaceae bacterium]|nr:hypothetical protein [Muribaculaceae bacterium]
MTTQTTSPKFSARKLASGMIAAGLAASMMAPTAAFAITADETKNQPIQHERAVNNVGKTAYWLQIVEDADKGGLGNMSVDVPIKVTLAIDSEGHFITPSALKNVIENDSEFPLDVVGMTLTEKDGFGLRAATGFGDLNDKNIFSGEISSVKLNADYTEVEKDKQVIGFTKLGQFAENAAWRMESSDNTDKKGEDCLYIQIDGEIGNVAGKYFTAPINMFDITYTFAAADSDPVATPGDLAD